MSPDRTPLPPQDFAEYVREMARELAATARTLGLSTLSTALEQTERAADASLQPPAKAAEGDAA